MNYEFNKTRKQKNNKTVIIIVIVFLFSCFIAAYPQASVAQSLLQNSDTAKYSGDCISKGSCTLNDFIVLIIRASQIILGIVGSVALLMFVYGGFKMIISAGSNEQVTSAKSILQNAIIGLVIVFASWSIINFVYYTFVDTDSIDNKKWYQLL